MTIGDVDAAPPDDRARPPGPGDRAVLAWLGSDLWMVHRGQVLRALGLWVGGAAAQALGLSLLAAVLKALGQAGGHLDGGARPVLFAAGLLACFGLAAQLSYAAAMRTLDLLVDYMGRCTTRLRDRFVAAGLTASADKATRRSLVRLCVSDVTASAHAVRIALEMLPPLVMLAVATATLAWLHPGATIMLAALAVPWYRHLRALARDMAGIAGESLEAPGTDEAKLRGRRRSAVDFDAELAAVTHKPGLRLRRLYVQGRSRWLTDTFATAALAAVLVVLALTRDEARQVGLLLAYVVVLRQALASLQGVVVGTTTAARFWPAVRRHHAAAVLGQVPQRAREPDDDGELA
jgi:hypothetical protein